MRRLISLILLFGCVNSNGQELYVFTEPASNLPTTSLSVKLSGELKASGIMGSEKSHRILPNLGFGLNKKLMLRSSASFSNMNGRKWNYESFSIYAKYRFISWDKIHQHFRMAIFGLGSKSSMISKYDEISLYGDNTGLGGGIITTGLWSKFALSGTVSHFQVWDSNRKESNYRCINYSLSGGLLVLPKSYTDYKQTNLNIYLELLGQQSYDIKRYYLDLAPAVQIIFNSNSRLNFGYRFQLIGRMDRMSTDSWHISYERIFLNCFNRKER